MSGRERSPWCQVERSPQCQVEVIPVSGRNHPSVRYPQCQVEVIPVSGIPTLDAFSDWADTVMFALYLSEICKTVHDDNVALHFHTSFCEFD